MGFCCYLHFLDVTKGATELQNQITEDESGNSATIEQNNLIKVKFSLIPPATVNTNDTNSLRYPTNHGITNDHDYVTFQFYKYTPPFRKGNQLEVEDKQNHIQNVVEQRTKRNYC